MTFTERHTSTGSEDGRSVKHAGSARSRDVRSCESGSTQAATKRPKPSPSFSYDSFERRVLRMFRNEKMDTLAIAQTLGTPEHEIVAALHRAREEARQWKQQEATRRERNRDKARAWMTAARFIRRKLRLNGITPEQIDAELKRRPA